MTKEEAELYFVESSDTGRVMTDPTDPMDRGTALAKCRRFNAIPAGKTNSGNYRVVAAKSNSR